MRDGGKGTMCWKTLIRSNRGVLEGAGEVGGKDWKLQSVVANRTLEWGRGGGGGVKGRN